MRASPRVMEMPTVHSPEDMRALVARVRVVREYPRQMVSSAVLGYAVEQLVCISSVGWAAPRARCGPASGYMLKPPEVSMVCPVIQRAPLERRNAMTAPTSSASPRRPSAVRVTIGGITWGDFVADGRLALVACTVRRLKGHHAEPIRIEDFAAEVGLNVSALNRHRALPGPRRSRGQPRRTQRRGRPYRGRAAHRRNPATPPFTPPSSTSPTAILFFQLAAPRLVSLAAIS